MSYFAHPTAIIDDGCEIGEGVKIWHFSHIMTGCKIGDDCNLGQNVVVSPKVVLGKNVRVQNNVSIYEGVICEDDVFLGPSMVFTNVINPRSAVSRKHEYLKTRVRRGASIGANATIICGNEIGEYDIGAGTVNYKTCSCFALIMANPGKTNWLDKEYGHRLNFDRKRYGQLPGQEKNMFYKTMLLANQITDEKFYPDRRGGYIAPRHMKAVKDTGNNLIAALTNTIRWNFGWITFRKQNFY
jgi:UDP-2-acetamido-3-amino-2,3-dideoxy-glucuronate N-acetyltransferase